MSMRGAQLEVSRRVALARSGRKALSLFLRSYREERAESVQQPAYAKNRDKIEFIQGWSNPEELESLYLLASTVPPTESIVEVGSFCGRSTVALALGAGSRDHSVISVDTHDGSGTPVEREMKFTSESTLRFNLALARVDKAVDVRVVTSADAASAYGDDRRIGLLFIDGLHTTDAVVTDARLWSPHLGDDPVEVFDDWLDASVMAGIERAERAGLLPPRLGTVGRHLVFASRHRVSAVLPRLRTLAEIAAGNRWFLRNRALRYVGPVLHSEQRPTPIQ